MYNNERAIELLENSIKRKAIITGKKARKVLASGEFLTFFCR